MSRVGCALCMAAAQVKEGHLVDALARRGDEGRGPPQKPAEWVPGAK